MKNNNSFKQYLKLMSIKAKDYKKFFPLIFICSLCFSILSVFMALISRQVIDNLLAMNSLIIVKVILIAISAYLMGAALGFSTTYLEKYIIDKLKIKFFIIICNVQNLYFLAI